MNQISNFVTDHRSKPWTAIPIVPALCWLALWGSINTSPWDISFDTIESKWTGAFNGIRAGFPLVVLVIWVLHLLGRRTTRVRRPTTPEMLWFFYAAVCLIATVGVGDWFSWAYWGLAFLSTLACVEMFLAESEQDLEGAASLNQLSWVIATVILVLVVKAAGGHLVEQTSVGLSGYAVNVKMPEVAGMAMVRSTGISRFAGAIGLVAFVAVWHSRSWPRLVMLAIFAFCCWLVWVMQARGATVSFVGAIGVMLVLLGGRARTVGIIAIAGALAAVGLGYISHDSVVHVWRYASRDDHHLAQMHGRLGIYNSVWRAFWDSPLIGYGPQADRRVTFINAQNGFLYALLCGGFIGGGAWIAGFALTFVYMARAIMEPSRIPTRDSDVFIQVAGLMVFFALRTIPENTAALFSVDLMLQLPAMVYLGELMRTTRQPVGHERTYLFAVPRTVPNVPHVVRSRFIAG